MPCVNPDGTLTFAARDVLRSLGEPRSEEEVRVVARQPIYRVRSSLREMETPGWVVERDSHYSLTEAGREKLGQLVG
jgi:predicted transcriptional regulator